MSQAITSYKVGACRSIKGGPVRWLVLELATPVGEIRRVSLFFYEKLPAERGFANRATGALVGHLAVSDFEAVYRIVQTEKPVFVHWTLDPEGPLVSIDVSTSHEPLGEGEVDLSP